MQGRIWRTLSDLLCSSISFFKEKYLGKIFIDPMEIMLFFLSNSTNWSYNSIFLVFKNSMLLCNSGNKVCSSLCFIRFIGILMYAFLKTLEKYVVFQFCDCRKPKQIVRASISSSHSLKICNAVGITKDRVVCN